MKQFSPTPPYPGNAAEAAAAPPVSEADLPEFQESVEQAKPRFQPADPIYTWEDGEGIRNRFPAEAVLGWSRPAEELDFDMRQLTMAERCQAFRMAERPGGTISPARMDNLGVQYAVRRVGSLRGADLTDEFMTRWLEDLGFQAYQLLLDTFGRLNNPDEYMSTKFTASRRTDVVARKHSYTVPAASVPRKRWAKRLRRDTLRWVVSIDEKTKLDHSHWTLDGDPVDPATAEEFSRDLSFELTELTMESFEQVSNILEDPDDQLAARFMNTMWSISAIGGRRLTNSVEDLVIKRKWLEDIGPRALNMVAGAYARLHEVDRGLQDSFRVSATALD